VLVIKIGKESLQSLSGKAKDIVLSEVLPLDKANNKVGGSLLRVFKSIMAIVILQ